MPQQIMYPGKINSPQTELASAIDDEQTTIPLLDASVLPAPPNLATLGTGEDAETILYTGVEGNTLTGVTRGFQGVARAWVAGTKVARLFTAYDHEAFRANIIDHETRIEQNTSAVQQVAAALDEHKNEIVQPYYEFWVNSDIGDDNNDGKTSSTPFATIKKAIDSVPNGVQGQIRLFGNSPHVIDQDIYLYNKNIHLLSVQTATINKLSSARIYLINSSLTGGYQDNWYVEDILFHVAGLSSISLGGHENCTIRPLSETSNVTVCYLVYSYGSGLLQGYPSFLSFTGRRLRFRTDNFPTYSGTYNVFRKELESGIIVSKFWQLTKDETVNWGLTENVLGDGAGGLSQWY